MAPMNPNRLLDVVVAREEISKGSSPAFMRVSFVRSWAMLVLLVVLPLQLLLLLRPEAPCLGGRQEWKEVVMIV